MKRFFKAGNYKTNINISLLLLRVSVGLFMLTHSYPKIQSLLSGEPIEFLDPLNIGMTFSLLLAIFSEAICSFLILLGLFTRLAVIPLIITMLVIVFAIHGEYGLAKQEFPSLYLVIYLVILMCGPGKHSIDKLIYK